MVETSNGKKTFIEEMRRKIIQYQIQKIKLTENEPHDSSFRKRELRAKQTLIQMDEQSDATHMNQEDIVIGRWSNYKVPDKFGERLCLGKPSRKKNNLMEPLRFLRCDSEREKLFYNYHCSSERMIPKLKSILHQLETPSNKKTPKQRQLIDMKNKMISHMSREALIIANKVEIKPTVKSERSRIGTMGPLINSENKRPLSGYSQMKNPPSSNYQKIKRTPQFGNLDSNIVHEKQILSQLIKGGITKSSSTVNVLSNMTNYFTISTNDKKRTISKKFGLDNVLA